jgi:lysophospholipase L1-like esterase
METLVCFGDSLTEGYGAAYPFKIDKTKACPAYLRERIKIPVINAGVSGDTTFDGLARLERDVLSRNPRIVILEFGANDFLSRTIHPAETKRNLQGMIDALYNGARKIYVVKFYTPEVFAAWCKDMALYAQAAESLMAPYERMYRELLAANDIGFIEDMWSGVWDSYECMSDEIHPNARGYKKIADKYFAALEGYLAANGLLKDGENS